MGNSLGWCCCGFVWLLCLIHIFFTLLISTFLLIIASRPEYNVNVYLLPLEDLLIYISDIGNRIDTERIKLKYVNLLHEIKHIWHRLESYQGCCEGIRKAYANPKNEKLLAEMFFETLRNAKLMGDCYRLCLEVSEAIRELACDVFEHHPVANLMIIKGDRSNNSIKICHHHNMHAIETSEKDQVSSHHSPSDMKGINPEVDLDVEMNKIDHHTNTHICLSALCIFSAFLIDFDMLKVCEIYNTVAI